MSDEESESPSGVWGHTKALASTWASSKRKQLQDRARPSTKVDSGGTRDSYTFDGQEIDRSELREIKKIRTSGGVVAQLVHGKALMQFGMGASFEAENDEAAEWLHDQFNDLDNLLIDIGEDATWFPFSLGEIVETQGGDFSHIELIEPWTMVPITNEVGEIIAWEQEIRGNGTKQVETFDPDEIASFVLNKAYGRDKTGLSEVKRAEEEIENYKENQRTINDALEYLIPHHHWKVGQEGGMVIDDNELRRFRNKIDNLKGDTQIVSGKDVEQDAITLPEFDVQTITDNDMRQLCVALGVPIELASVIAEGLGSGEQSNARELFFQLERRAKQRSLGGQFVEEIARQLLEDYSPFDSSQDLDLVFDETQEIEERKKKVEAIGEDMTVNERRAMFDLAELDDEEKGESFDSPGEENSTDDPMDGLFGSDSGNVNLADGKSDIANAPEWDSHLLELHQKLWDADSETRLLNFTGSQTPEFVLDRIKDAIRSGAIFTQFDTIPSSELMNLREHMTEALTESDGWTIDGVADQLMDLDGDIDRDKAEVIARTETASILNSAREDGYQERGEEDDLFYWSGSLDNRTTEACSWLIEKTNPHEGGNPVSLERLKELIEEAPTHDPDMQDNLARPENFVIHPNERKTFIRHVA